MSNLQRWIVATGAALAFIATAIANASAVWSALKHLNLSITVACISSLVLMALGIESYVQWLNKQFARQELVIADLSRRLLAYDGKLSQQLSDLTSAITADCEKRLKKEIDSRVAGEIADRNRMTDAETRVGKLERWIKPPDHA